MQSISEHWWGILIHGLVPPFGCLCQYFVTITLALSLVALGFRWPLMLLTILLVSIAVLMLPFWYKTFFDRTFVGPDRPLWVQWSSDQVRFQGAYFNIEVPLEKILEYKVVNPYTFRTIPTYKVINSKRTFILKVKVKKANGAIETMYLSTTMPKKGEFISFLEERQTHQDSHRRNSRE